MRIGIFHGRTMGAANRPVRGLRFREAPPGAVAGRFNAGFPREKSGASYFDKGEHPGS